MLPRVKLSLDSFVGNMKLSRKQFVLPNVELLVIASSANFAVLKSRPSRKLLFELYVVVNVFRR